MILLLKNVLFTVFVPGTVAVYIPLRVAGARGAADPFLIGPGVLLLALGAATYAWSVWEFATRGKGTPAPVDAPKRLMFRGLYKHTRNPMYIGVLTVLLGWALVFGSSGLLLYALLVATCFHCMIVFYEEPHLARTFGAEYETYRSRVGRWIPKPRKSAT